MKRQETKFIRNDEDTTMTLQILVGETFEDTIVTEKLSIDEESGEKYTHFTLETPSLDDQVTRSLEDLMKETEGEEAEAALVADDLTESIELLDEIVVGDPSSDALELELMGDDA